MSDIVVELLPPQTIEIEFPIVGINGEDGQVVSVVAGDHILVDDTDPANPIVALETLTASDVGADASGSAATALTNANTYTDTQIDALSFVETVSAGANISIDDTDPQNPIISASGAAASVSSVNTQTGDVVLDQDDILDGTTFKQYSQTEKSKLAGIAAGAEVNVNADWNSASGDSQILNKPTIPSIANLFNKTVDDTDDIVESATKKFFLSTERTKLTGIATAATANQTDAFLLARANHTGTQTSSTISDFNSATDARINTQKGVANGLAELDGSGKINSSELPAIAITETFAVASQAAMLALTAQQGDVAIRSDINKTFILSTNSPGTLADWLELKTPTDAVLSWNTRTGAIVPATSDYNATQIDNTPSGNIAATNVQSALNELDTEKVATTRTINGYALSANVTLAKADVGLGSVDNTSDTAKPVSTATQTALNLKANIASPTFTGTVTIPTGASITAPTGLVKADVGLSNVDNTSDSTKNASTSTLTNKRIQPRAFVSASASTLTPEKDTYDAFSFTALAANLTINNHSTSTVTNFEKIQIRILDNGTPRTLTFDTNYVARGGIALPTTTVANKIMTLGFEWLAASSKFNLIAFAQEA